jgi:hypothetical protein
MFKNTYRFTVNNYRPVQWAVTIIALSTLFALGTWLALDERHWSVIIDRMTLIKEYNRLGEVNQKLAQENAGLTERVLMLERAAKLDKETASLLQKNVQLLQDEIYQLKGELRFYRGIMDSTRESIGLNIQGIHVSSLPQERSYRMKLVLTNVADVDKGSRLAPVKLNVSIEGLRNGKSSYLNLQDIALEEGLELSFKFRNFKRFESDLELPAGFTPRRVLVQLQPGDGTQTMIKKAFDWPELT